MQTVEPLRSSRNPLRYLAAAIVLCASVALAGCAGHAPQRDGQSAAAPLATPGTQMADALPSWQDSAARAAILKFVGDVTRDGSPSYVRPEARIAVFDNDGTLWSERPMPFQLLFMIDRLKAAAPQHPEWQRNPVFKALMAHDAVTLAKNENALLQLLEVANSGMTTDQYDQMIRDWLASARHPTLDRPYTSLVYQPQLELLALLRANGFQIWIVSGGTAEFMRVWVNEAYGIPPERVVGTQEKLKYGMRDGKPVLVREPGIEFNDDGPGKPVGIVRAIGQRPILAFGNSDGDREMLEYTTAGTGPSLGLLLHHDDASREFAYDRHAGSASLDKAWDEAAGRGWIVVSMKQDWKTVFPAKPGSGTQ
ncbi:haloacid dehalogenase-like hydrolase [Paraburkholderia sp. Ac-20340]|uniref:HAD family hydrolase n=1 Tax=Paraburkholderia sp. Ac-20340 TaxID=2703888 RepID=UPI00197ED206|nr:HAD family hydrolase [Paraburkholderia sp. Ac-20340]MBN3853326.1 haloacid dehalogenase-like hydrolase [Paraburkholderia sp. Ac-20340]